MWDESVLQALRSARLLRDVTDVDLVSLVREGSLVHAWAADVGTRLAFDFVRNGPGVEERVSWLARESAGSAAPRTHVTPSIALNVDMSLTSPRVD